MCAEGVLGIIALPLEPRKQDFKNEPDSLKHRLWQCEVVSYNLWLYMFQIFTEENEKCFKGI